MYKIFSILFLMAVCSTAFSQEKQDKYFTPHLLQVPGTNGKSTVLPRRFSPPVKSDIEKAKEFVSSTGPFDQHLSPDNMPCVVPDITKIAAIPNGFSSKIGQPYMPNSMPLYKKSTPR